MGEKKRSMECNDSVDYGIGKKFIEIGSLRKNGLKHDCMEEFKIKGKACSIE